MSIVLSQNSARSHAREVTLELDTCKGPSKRYTANQTEEGEEPAGIKHPQHVELID
jgi:hypothetical protein